MVKASKKESVLAFIGLTVAGLMLLGGRIFDPFRLAFEAVRDPNPWLVSYPWRAFTRLSVFSGEFPVWNPYSGLGEPFLANFQSGVFSVLRWPYLFLPLEKVIAPLILFQLVFAGFGAWLFAKKLRLGNASSFLCALGFMLSGYLVQYMNNQHIVIDLLIPWGLLAAENMNRKAGFRNLIFLILVLALVILGGQPGAAIFTVAFIALYFLFRTVPGRRAEALALLCVALSVSAAVSLIQLLPFLESLPQSWTYHPPGYALQHLEIRSFATIFAPLYGTSRDLPWPVQQTMPWAGITVSFLCLTSILNLKKLRKAAGFFALVMIAGLGIVYGLPVFNLVARLPFLNRLSGFVYLQPLIFMSMAMLAGFGFEAIFRRKAQIKMSRPFLIILILLCWASYYYHKYWLGVSPLPAQAFAVAVFLLCLIALLAKLRLFWGWSLIVLAVIEPLDLTVFEGYSPFWFNMEKIELLNFRKLAGQNRYARFAAEPKAWIPNQMLTLPLYDAGIADAVIPKSYVRLVNRLNGYKNEDELLTDFFAYESLRLKEQAFADPLSRLLGVKAFLRKSAPEGQGDGYWLDENPGARKYSLTGLYGDAVYVVPFEDPLPRVFFPQRLIFSRDDEQSWELLSKVGNFDDEAVTVVKESRPAALEVFVRPESHSLKLGLSRVDLSYRSDGQSFAVFSEQYYPGWRAYLDGSEIKIHPADYLLRGVFLPAGDHQLKMVYRPWGFRTGLYASLAGLLACAIFIAGSSAARSRRGPGPEVS